MESEKNIPCRFLNFDIPYYFIQRIEEYNSIFGQKQIQNIQFTLSLIDNNQKNDKIEQLIKMNIQKCTDWCIKYNIPHFSLFSNIFNEYNYDPNSMISRTTTLNKV
jgi:hypothetical protein